jgi:hypothetical protein
MWHEAAMTYFEEPYHHLPGGTEQNMVKLQDNLPLNTEPKSGPSTLFIFIIIIIIVITAGWDQIP